MPRFHRVLTYILPFLLVLAGGCVSPTVTTFDHAPDPSLRQAKPFPATVAVMPWDDSRQKKGPRPGAVPWWVLLPGFLYWTVEYQSGAGPEWDLGKPPANITSAKSKAEYYAALRDTAHIHPFAPQGTESILPLLARYLNESGLFSPVYLGEQTYAGQKVLKNMEPGAVRSAPPPAADYVVMPELRSWESAETDIFYLSGLTSGPYLCVAGFPAGYGRHKYDLSLSLVRCVDRQTVLTRQYTRTCTTRLQGVPWGSWIYGESRPMSGYMECSSQMRRFIYQDALPQIRADMEDFVRSVQKALPPPEDTAYWAKIAQARARRLAGAVLRGEEPQAVTAGSVPAPRHGDVDLSVLRPAGRPVTVAVADLTGLALGKDEVATLSEKVRTVLAKTKFFRLLSRNDMENVLAAQKFQRTGNCDETQCLAEMGRVLAVQKIIGGTIGRVGARFSLSLRLVDVETAQIDQQVDRDATCATEDLLDEIKALTVELALKYATEKGPATGEN